jgi:hypothetical protein
MERRKLGPVTLDPEAHLRTSILLSAQTALLGAIPSNVRGVSIGWTDAMFIVRDVFSSEPNEKEIDAIQVATTEIVAYLGGDMDCDEEFIVSSEPLRSLAIGPWVFQRLE